jgi:hypothetical protein
MACGTPPLTLRGGGPRVPPSLCCDGTAAAGGEIAAAAVVAGLANLVAKSLVAAEIDGAAARFRLPITTRAYALDRLADSGEGEAVAGCYAEHCRSLGERGTRPDPCSFGLRKSACRSPCIDRGSMRRR